MALLPQFLARLYSFFPPCFWLILMGFIELDFNETVVAILLLGAEIG